MQVPAQVAVNTTTKRIDIKGKRFVRLTIGAADVLVNIVIEQKTTIPPDDDYGTLKANKTYLLDGQHNPIYAIWFKTATGTSTVDIIAENVRIVGEPSPTFTAISVPITTHDTGDLEAATKTITQNPSAAATPDYTQAHTMTNPVETVNGVVQATSRLKLTNLGVRLLLDVDSLSTGSVLTTMVKIGTKTCIMTTNAAGANQILVGNISLLSTTNGFSEIVGNAIEVYLYKDVAGTGDTIVSKVSVQVAYGCSGIASTAVYRVNINGYLSLLGFMKRSGSGSGSLGISSGGASVSNGQVALSGMTDQSTIGGMYSGKNTINMAGSYDYVVLGGSVATDLYYLTSYQYLTFIIHEVTA